MERDDCDNDVCMDKEEEDKDVTSEAMVDVEEEAEEEYADSEWLTHVGSCIAAHGMQRRMEGENGAIMKTTVLKARELLLNALGATNTPSYSYAARSHVETHGVIRKALQDLLVRMDSRGVCMARDKPGKGGSKVFMVGEYDKFYDLICKKGNPNDALRHYYEVLPCEPYPMPVNVFMDMDWKCATKEETVEYLALEVRLIEEFTQFLMKELGVRRSDVTAHVMDSSRPLDGDMYMKMSRHITWKIRGIMFRDVTAVGALLRTFELHVGQQWGERSPADKDNMWYKFVTDKLPEFVCDMAVYTKGRNFRVLWSCKDGSIYVLVPVEAGKMLEPGVREAYVATKEDVDRYSVLYPPSAVPNGNGGYHPIRLVAVAQPYGPRLGQWQVSSNSLNEHWIVRKFTTEDGEDKELSQVGGKRARKGSSKRTGGILDMLTTQRTRVRKHNQAVVVQIGDLEQDLRNALGMGMSRVLLDFVALMSLQLKKMGTRLNGPDAELAFEKSSLLHKLVKDQMTNNVARGRFVDAMQGSYNTEEKVVFMRHELHVCPLRAFCSKEDKPWHNHDNSYIELRLATDGTNAVEVRFGCFSKKHEKLQFTEEEFRQPFMEFTKQEWTSGKEVAALFPRLATLEVSQDDAVAELVDFLRKGDDEMAEAPAEAE